MKKFRIVPQIISNEPPEVAKVNFPSGVEAKMGNVLTPKQVQEMPFVEWTADPELFYTLCMIDPDAPSPNKPKQREWQHWLVVNIPGNDVCSGEFLSSYISSAPPRNTGLHRYVFLIYEQPCIIAFEERRLNNYCTCARRNFHIAKFARKYALGQPIAGNFYRAEWDKYVPQVYRKMIKRFTYKRN